MADLCFKKNIPKVSIINKDNAKIEIIFILNIYSQIVVIQINDKSF
jgi:hypothetical protein